LWVLELCFGELSPQKIPLCDGTALAARDGISLRKWPGDTAMLGTSEGDLVAKKCGLLQQCFFFTHASLHTV